MREWNQLTDEEQIYLYWEYCAANDDDEILFSDFDEMMQGLLSSKFLNFNCKMLVKFQTGLLSQFPLTQQVFYFILS